jgi:SdiA-regulated
MGTLRLNSPRSLAAGGEASSNRLDRAIGRLALVLFVAASLSGFPPSTGAELPDLEVIRVTFGTSSQEISGAAFIQGNLHVVADGPQDLGVYAVRRMGNRFELETHFNLGTLRGYHDYIASLETDPDVAPKDRLIDFEGLCSCGRTIYLANERARHILRVRSRKVEQLPIDFRSFKELKEGGSNAGFEGVAVDCKKGLMYVAKERSPRVIFTVRTTDWKVLSMDSPEPSGGSAEDTAGVAPDFSDLAFDKGHLYVLERSARQIAKVDPAAMKVVARFSYADAERGLYDTDPRFGLAEGLALSSSQVVLGFDNNGAQLTRAASERFGVTGNPSAIIYFKRPRGF